VQNWKEFKECKECGVTYRSYKDKGLCYGCEEKKKPRYKRGFGRIDSRFPTIKKK
jgi:hypothetical protein